MEEIRQYIVTKLGPENYGIEIGIVDNIVRMQKITRVPKVQPYYIGVMNIRGEIIPVISLRKKLGLGEDVITEESRILIVKPEPQANVGILVDEVDEVVMLEDKDIDYEQSKIKDANAIFLEGVGKYENKLVSILNISTIPFCLKNLM